MLDLTVVPANEASWDDLQAVFGAGGDPSRAPESEPAYPRRTGLVGSA
jgi:hypothetical protein